jgi:hypothetical protein
MLAADGKFLSEALDDKLGLCEAAVPRGELLAGDVFNIVVRFEIFEIAMAISFGDASASEGAFGAVAQGAIAGNRPDHPGFAGGRAGARGIGRSEGLGALRGSLDNFPTAALADGTFWSRHMGRISAASDERKRTRLCKFYGDVEIKRGGASSVIFPRESRDAGPCGRSRCGIFVHPGRKYCARLRCERNG